MIIGVTKKTQPLFSALPTIEDKENGKRFAQVNPLFSWHANYINVNRKKILILLNDQTYTPIILHDINAQKKKQLPELISEAIHVAFDIAGVSNEKTEEYLKVAGEIQVTTTSNRSVLGSVNLVIADLSFFRLNMNQTINSEAMTFFSNYIHTQLFKQGYGSSVEALKEALNKPLRIEEAVEKSPYFIEKTWDYSQVPLLDDWNISEEKWEEFRDLLVEHNEKMLMEFKRYLVEGKGLSKKTAKRHADQLDFYLNIYLTDYEKATPVDSGDSVDSFLGDFIVRKDLMSSKTSLKQTGSALKKLYQFLYEAGEISENDLDDTNEFIKSGIQEGEELLSSIMDDDDLWF
ncbi:DUF6933 domain-containing protein [Desemzia sp. FAM 23991]|uniref:DUF6933 domain-containing protein n=2 Tax=Desemzia TaxID=82800 RepID=UPI00388432E2